MTNDEWGGPRLPYENELPEESKGNNGRDDLFPADAGQDSKACAGRIGGGVPPESGQGEDSGRSVFEFSAGAVQRFARPCPGGRERRRNSRVVLRKRAPVERG